ncbi:MAG: Fic family protein [Chitinophagaceae bacterium]|nr:MAG: Fic family protein [Chitinophagaceae bacterium]
MAKRAEKIAQQLARVREVLSSYPDGLPFEELAQAVTISAMTLRRRLPLWEEQGFIRKTAVTRGNRYAVTEPTERARAEQEVVPLSEAGRAIAALVNQPEALRQPVGYNFQFLQGYEPNRSAYLSVEERAQLRAIGATPAADQPAGTYARQVLHRLLIDLSYNSSRLEGNTYSLLDTQRLLQAGVAAAGKAADEAQMILNHKEAIGFLLEPAAEIGINRYTLLSIHALLSDNLLADSAASGRLRQQLVGITRSVYTPPGIPQQIEEYFEQLLAKAAAIDDPFEQAFFLMVQLPYLQPFDDGNKRVSRLAANIPLNQHNLVPLAFVDVPQDLYVQGLLGIYELNRVELLKDVFLFAYERSAARYSVIRQTLGDPDPFRMQYREQLRAVVQEVVLKGTTLVAAIAKSGVPQPDLARLRQVVESELESLHEGNIARYRITPGEFARWKEGKP